LSADSILVPSGFSSLSQRLGCLELAEFQRSMIMRVYQCLQFGALLVLFGVVVCTRGLEKFSLLVLDLLLTPLDNLVRLSLCNNYLWFVGQSFSHSERVDHSLECIYKFVDFVASFDVNVLLEVMSLV